MPVLPCVLYLMACVLQWLVEARQWRWELGRRVNVNKLIKTATARNSAVTLAMVDRASQVRCCSCVCAFHA